MCNALDSVCNAYDSYKCDDHRDAASSSFHLRCALDSKWVGTRRVPFRRWGSAREALDSKVWRGIGEAMKKRKLNSALFLPTLELLSEEQIVELLKFPLETFQANFPSEKFARH